MNNHNINQDERDLMLEIILRKKRTEIPILPDKTTKTFDTSEIYDDPILHMTTRGIFRYTNVDVIPW